MLNEKYFPIRLTILIIIAIILGAMAGEARAQHVDLQDGMQLTPFMPCKEDDSPNRLLCVIIEKEGKQYLLFLDRKGEFKIFIIEDDTPRLIWAREMV